MKERIKSLIVYEYNLTISNRMAIFYTLGFPLIFLFLNLNDINKNINLIYGCWSYIVVTGVLNGIDAGIINMRETNFLKMYSYIAKSKLYIYYSNLIVQTTFILTGLLIFNIFGYFIVKNMDFIILARCMLMSLIIIPFCGIALSFFLLLKVKMSTFNIILNCYLIIMLTTAYIKVPKIINSLLLFLNPFKFNAYLYDINLPKQYLGIWSIVIIYLIVGFISIYIMPIRGNTSRY